MFENTLLQTSENLPLSKFPVVSKFKTTNFNENNLFLNFRLSLKVTFLSYKHAEVSMESFQAMRLSDNDESSIVIGIDLFFVRLLPSSYCGELGKEHSVCFAWPECLNDS